LREYCIRRTDLAPVGEFVDICSGARGSRPKLNELLMAARQRKIACVLVWKIDRLGRSLRHLVNTISDLEAVGVAFISYKDALDFSDTHLPASEWTGAGDFYFGNQNPRPEVAVGGPFPPLER
jgi:DNA invertase Pin-like site-specific DNA recombinase